MRRLVLLDTGVIGLLIEPTMSPEATACTRWIERLEAARVTIQIPPVCYFESRREWERLILRDQETEPIRCRRWSESLGKLVSLAGRTGFAPIEVRTMIVAARLWGEARHKGYATADDRSLDADVILAATALRAMRGGRDVRVITTNVDHIARYVPACRWDEYPAD